MSTETGNNEQTTEQDKVPTPGTPEYDQYMLDAAARGRQANGQEPFQKPDQGQEQEQEQESSKLPEGVSIDDLLAAWNAQQEAEKNNESEDGEGGDQNLSQEQESESTDSGLSPEQKKLQEDLEAMRDELITEKVLNAAGGKDEFEALKERASNELSETENFMLSEALEKGTAEQAVAAVQMLQRLLGADASVETHGRFVNGKPAPTDNAFANRAELHAAMADPKYRDRGPVGEAYRQEIETKLKRSRFG